MRSYDKDKLNKMSLRTELKIMEEIKKMKLRNQGSFKE